MLAWVIDHPVQAVFRLLAFHIANGIRALHYMHAIMTMLQVVVVTWARGHTFKQSPSTHVTTNM